MARAASATVIMGRVILPAMLLWVACSMASARAIAGKTFSTRTAAELVH